MIVYIIIIYNVITQIHQPGPHSLPYQNTHPQTSTFGVVQLVTRHFASRDPRLYVTRLFSRGIVFLQEAWGPQTERLADGTNRCWSHQQGAFVGPLEETVIFSMSHRGLRGVIPYTRCHCDAGDKLSGGELLRG